MKNFIKMNKVMNTTINTVSSFAKYRILVAPGVYQSISGKYFVRKTDVNGKRGYTTFTNKAKAIKFYKSL